MSTDKIYVGIDPGAKGAIAYIEPNKVTIIDMPQPEEALMFFSHINPKDNYNVGIELVHALPGQSCTAMFTYGENFLLAKLLGLWYNRSPVMIPPQRWKKHYGLKRAEGESKAEFKRRSVDLARKLYPDLTDILKYSKDGRAEALLIAHYLKELDSEEGQ